MLIAVIVIAIVSFIIGVFYFKHKKIVIANSVLYKKIRMVNQKYAFDYNIKPVLYFCQTCKSKKSLDNFDFAKNLQKIVADNLVYYERLIDKLNYNSKFWIVYKEE